jgi:hypothetical protein
VWYINKQIRGAGFEAVSGTKKKYRSPAERNGDLSSYTLVMRSTGPAARNAPLAFIISAPFRAVNYKSAVGRALSRI